MTKFKFIYFLSIILFFISCSKAPNQVKLDDKNLETINQNLIQQQKRSIPKDPYLLKQKNLIHKMVFLRKKNEYIQNDKVVKAFFLAQNSTKILISGNETIAKEYKKYFLQNQVTADIKIHSIDTDKNYVDVFFIIK